VKVEFVEPEAGFAAILEDPQCLTIIDEIVSDRTLLLLVSEIILSYYTLTALKGAKGIEGPNVHRFAEVWTAPKKKQSAGRRIANAFVALYTAHNPDHVRGALLEGLVERKLAGRYGATDQQLVNNHKLRCINDDTYTTSRSVDVVGWDSGRRVGECHDCKVSSKEFKRGFIRELERDVVPRGFKVGLVTAHSRQTTLFSFKKKEIELRVAQIVSLERLWDLAPLQP
jgi:hypothetical protein